jgi:hypothetical protein
MGGMMFDGIEGSNAATFGFAGAIGVIPETMQSGQVLQDGAGGGESAPSVYPQPAALLLVAIAAAALLRATRWNARHPRGLSSRS